MWFIHRSFRTCAIGTGDSCRNAGGDCRACCFRLAGAGPQGPCFEGRRGQRGAICVSENAGPRVGPGFRAQAQTEACACGMCALGPCTPRTREAQSVPAPQTPPSGGVLPSPGRTCRASGSGRCGPLPRHAEDTLSPLPPSLPPAWRRGVRIASNSLKGQRDGAAQPKRQTMTMTMTMTTATGGEQSEARTPACRGGGRPRRAGCGVAAAAPGSPVPSPGRGEGTTAPGLDAAATGGCLHEPERRTEGVTPPGRAGQPPRAARL